MRLLMISGDRSLLADKKGAFWYTLEEMRKHWERIDIVCPKGSVESGKWKVENDRLAIFSNVFLHSSPHGLWYQPRWILQKGKELIAAHHHGVMTVHEFPPFYNGIGARRLHKATGIPYALEIHHVVGFPRPSGLQERIGYALSRMYLRADAKRAKAVRCVSKQVAEILIRFGIPKHKITVVPSFYLDAEALAPSGVTKKYDIVACGRMVPNKGFDVLLEALAKIPKATLLLIGDGPERNSLTQKAKQLEIFERVAFVGWLPAQEDVYRAMESAKVFVCPSKSEGGPRVALEAMALGLPVVTTKVGVMPEVIHDEENGLFTTGEAADMAKKSQLLLESDALRKEIGQEARKILNVFERRKLIQKYAEFLQQLV